MLNRNQPAEFISIIYPETGHPVRFHRHTENNSIWIAGKDACAIIGITNPSHVAKRIDAEKVKKHRAKTATGFLDIVWYEVAAVIDLARQECRYSVITWLRMICAKLPNNAQSHVFEDPILIEKSTLTKLLDILAEIESQIR